MMQTNKFPLKYYLLLFLILVLAIIFWLVVLGFNKNAGNNEQTSLERIIDRVFVDKITTEDEYWQQEFIPDEIAQIIPIDSTKIINDTVNQRRIVSNLVNIAIKNSTNSIAKFASELKKIYPSDDYKIVYIDSVVNRLQVELPEKERLNFKVQVKTKLSQYKQLVWDEMLFDYVKTFNDPQMSDDKKNWYLRAININELWNQTTGKKEVVIAVIDNGFDLDHPELKGKFIKPYNVIDKSEDVSPSKINHGTHVASTIVANGNNNQGIVGICPDCSFMPIKVEDKNGFMTNTAIIDAILYAIKNNVDVINLSLGMQIPVDLKIPIQSQKDYINSGAKDEEEFWIDLFNYANEKNITCVLAAGNSNIMTGFDPFQRVNSTIKVGAVNQNEIRADFSNYGVKTTIYAPGTNIYGAKYGNEYEFLQGTSMAAPIIAGIVGLLKSKDKNLTNDEIRGILNKNTIVKDNIKIIRLQNQ